jgi:hypothetical protein
MIREKLNQNSEQSEKFQLEGNSAVKDIVRDFKWREKDN